MIHMKILYNTNDEKEMKAMMGFEPAHNGKNNEFSAGGDSTYCAIHADNKPHLTSEYVIQMF